MFSFQNESRVLPEPGEENGGSGAGPRRELSQGKEMRYRKRALQTAVNVVLLLGAVCTGASGQRSASVTASAPAKVYVAEFALSEDSKASSLNSFARQFFRLKVIGVSSVDLAGDSEVAPCGS